MKNNLNKIQKIMKIVGIITKVLMILSYVAVVALVAVALVCACGDKLAAFTEIKDKILAEADLTVENNTLAAVVGLSAVSLLALAVCLTFATRYFKAEQADGTPFAAKGAKQLALCGWVSLGAAVVNETVSGIMGLLLGNSFGAQSIHGSGILVGLILLFLSLIFTYGAETVSGNNGLTITHTKNDIILQSGENYTVTKDSKLKPGKYLLLATNPADEVIKVKLGGMVKDCRHNSEIVLAEGSEISPRSGDIILRS